MENILLLCFRDRPDIQLDVAFLTKRLNIPNLDDYKKLSRVVRYLCKTKDLPLTLEE